MPPGSSSACERIGELYLGGQKPEARRDAQELSRILEVLARQLDVLHRGIVAPELAALVEFDKRITELTAKLKTSRPTRISASGIGWPPP